MLGWRSSLGSRSSRFWGACALGYLSALLVASGTAFGLTHGRVYEMASPVYKGGYGATHIEAVAPNGEGVVFYSPGGFQGAPAGLEMLDYYARRNANGWDTRPLMVPATLAPDIVERDLSPSLGSVLAMGKPGTTGESADQGIQEGFWTHPTDAPDTPEQWEPIAGLLSETPGAPITFKYETRARLLPCVLCGRVVGARTGQHAARSGRNESAAL